MNVQGNKGELDKRSVVAKYATTASDGKTYQVEYFNLDEGKWHQTIWLQNV